MDDIYTPPFVMTEEITNLVIEIRISGKQRMPMMLMSVYPHWIHTV